MVIEIEPRGRDKFNDLATLKISYSKDRVETPNRLVTRHDINAKDNIGADIPLTSASKAFIMQVNVDPAKLQNILTKNGFMAQVLSEVKAFASRMETTKALVMLYPHLTDDAHKQLKESGRFSEFSGFFADVASLAGLETIVLPIIDGIEEPLKAAKKRNLQLVPVLSLKGDTQSLSKRYAACRSAGCNDVPIIAFKFASYPSANKGYNMVMDDLDKIHEARQATLMVDIPRVLPFNPQSISGPHYVPFFIADLVAETYRTAGWKKPPTVGEAAESPQSIRLFCKGSLVTPDIAADSTFNQKFNIQEELALFAADKKLQQLLQRVVENRIEERDWKQRRPVNLSRVHENLRTKDEFERLQKSITSNGASDYLSEKKDMSNVVKLHLKSRQK